MRLECLIGTFSAQDIHAEIDHCIDFRHDTSALDLSVPDAPAKTTCPESGHLPCSVEYTEHYYGNLPTEAPANTCNPCPNLPTLSGSASGGAAGGGAAGSAGSAGSGTGVQQDWKLIVRQVAPAVFDAAAKTSFLVHPDNSNSDTYMIVGQLNADDFKQPTGKFRFKIVYENTGFNNNQIGTTAIIWEQPTWLTARLPQDIWKGPSVMPGFDCIEIMLDADKSTDLGLQTASDPTACGPARPADRRFMGLGVPTIGSYGELWSIFDGTDEGWISGGARNLFNNEIRGWNNIAASSMHLYVHYGATGSGSAGSGSADAQVLAEVTGPNGETGLCKDSRGKHPPTARIPYGRMPGTSSQEGLDQCKALCDGQPLCMGCRYEISSRSCKLWAVNYDTSVALATALNTLPMLSGQTKEWAAVPESGVCQYQDCNMDTFVASPNQHCYRKQ